MRHPFPPGNKFQTVLAAPAAARHNLDQMVTPIHKGVVIVADDEEASRATTEDLLSDAGYLVLAARNGDEALSRMRGITGPAVAVVDLVMPGMDGFDLINKIVKDPDLKRIPIIVVTGQIREPVGAARVLRKPLKVNDLLKAVNELCR
jgi:CheY-like chemotaxis protein